MTTGIHSAYSRLRPQPGRPTEPVQAPAAPVMAPQDSYDLDGMRELIDQLQPPQAAKPQPAKPKKPKPKKEPVYRVKDLPKGLDVMYGAFKDEIKRADMVAADGTKARHLRAKDMNQQLGDLVKTGAWFNRSGRLTLNARQIADELCKPFSRTFDGARPNGAKAVVVDEVNDRLNVNPKAFAQGLALAKKRHPNRPIIVYLSHPDRLSPVLLKAVEKHADRVLVESYFWESRENGRITPDDFNKDYAPIARIAPGILKKAHPVLAISEKAGPYNFNDRKDVSFRRFLNDQAYALQHNPYTKHLRGLGAYATYEATPATLKFFDKLIQWYSKDGRNKKMPL